jgi:hypothetical protein
MTGLKSPLTGAMTWKAKAGIALALLVAFGIAIAAAYFVGKGKGQNISRVEITQYEGKVKELQGQLTAAQARVTTKVVTEYVTKIAYQDRIVYRNNDIIRTVVRDRPVEQTISKGAIYAHNQAAKLEPIDPTLAADGTPSGIQDGNLMGTVSDNYGTFHQVKEQLKSLQQWVTDTLKASEEVNREATRNN